MKELSNDELIALMRAGLKVYRETIRYKDVISTRGDRMISIWSDLVQKLRKKVGKKKFLPMFEKAERDLCAIGFPNVESLADANRHFEALCRDLGVDSYDAWEELRKQ